MPSSVTVRTPKNQTRHEAYSNRHGHKWESKGLKIHLNLQPGVFAIAIYYSAYIREFNRFKALTIFITCQSWAITQPQPSRISWSRKSTINSLIHHHQSTIYLTMANRSSLLANFLSLLALFFARLASNWSDKVFSLAFSAFDLWMLSIRTLLFLNTLPFTFMYMSWYMCLSIFFDSRYLRRRRLKTRILLIQRTFVGSLASLVPLRLPDWFQTNWVNASSYTQNNTWKKITCLYFYNQQ